MISAAAMLDEDMDEDCEIEDKKERGAIEYLNYEGDGIFDSIYEVMWTKQEDNDKAIEVVIPDTVVFKFNKPTGWYYTKITRGGSLRLHKKRSSALRMSLILKHFQVKSSHCCSDIVAYYISQTEVDAEQRLHASNIHYLAEQDLEHFLLHTKNKNGILQRFVDPKPSTSAKFYNSMVRCTWSQSVCLVERRTNVHSLKPPTMHTQKNARLSRYDRAETFEGDFRNSNEYPLTSAKLLEQIEVVCKRMVNHFLDVAVGKLAINRMVVNFKFDADTRLHFLWCESLRLDRKKHAKTLQFLAPKPNIIGKIDDEAFNLANKLKLPPKDKQGEEFKKCIFCKKECCAIDFVAVQYHTLLAAVDEIKLKTDEEKLKSKMNSAVSKPLARLRDRWKQLEERNYYTEIGRPAEQPSATARDSSGRFAVRPWRDAEPSTQAPEVEQPRDTGVPIDESSFTQPMDIEQGLLAHIDERQLMKDPMAALAQAQKEWDERHRRHDFEHEEQAQVTDDIPRSCQDFQGIPWFVKYLHPYMTPKDWLHTRNRQDFLRLTVSMCDCCFLTLTNGLSSEDTLRRHHRQMARRPRFDGAAGKGGAGAQSPSAASWRCAQRGAREARGDPEQKLPPERRPHGLSRLLVACEVRFPPPSQGSETPGTTRIGGMTPGSPVTPSAAYLPPLTGMVSSPGLKDVLSDGRASSSASSHASEIIGREVTGHEDPADIPADPLQTSAQLDTPTAGRRRAKPDDQYVAFRTAPPSAASGEEGGADGAAETGSAAGAAALAPIATSTTEDGGAVCPTPSAELQPVQRVATEMTTASNFCGAGAAQPSGALTPLEVRDAGGRAATAASSPFAFGGTPSTHAAATGRGPVSPAEHRPHHLGDDGETLTPCTPAVQSVSAGWMREENDTESDHGSSEMNNIVIEPLAPVFVPYPRPRSRHAPAAAWPGRNCVGGAYCRSRLLRAARRCQRRTAGVRSATALHQVGLPPPPCPPCTLDNLLPRLSLLRAPSPAAACQSPGLHSASSGVDFHHVNTGGIFSTAAG